VQHVQHIRRNQRREGGQLNHLQIGQILLFLFGVTHRARNHFVRITERQTFFHQIVGQIGCRCKTLTHRARHGIRFDGDAAHHVSVDAQGIGQRINRVEQRLLVFLIVLVVRQRLTLHQSQQTNQRAIDATGLAAHEFGHIRIFLLRHDRAAGAEAIGDVDKAKARTHPQDQLFGQTRKMSHGQRSGGGKFNRKITIRNRVERVFTNRIKAQQLGGVLALNRVSRARQGCCAQRQAVHTTARVGKTLGITTQHFYISEHVMTKSHRLRHLQVGKTRHQGFSVLFRQFQQTGLQFAHQVKNHVDRAAQIQADISGDLIVAAAAGMQTLAGIADLFGQTPLNIHVHVFEINAPVETTVADIVEDFRHAAADGIEVIGRQYPDVIQHRGMGERTLNVDFSHAAIESHRGGIAFDEFGDRFVKTARPSLVGRFRHGARS